MIKISAFNVESEESGSEEEVTKEALEQIASQQYAKALELQRKGSLTDAIQLLKDLLETELLYEVNKPPKGEKIAGPLFKLKYLCYKNLGSMLHEAGDLDAAIDAYTSASELDDTDITLWKRLGDVSIEAKNYEIALYAFQKGFERNPSHWPCLDKLVTLLLGLNYKEQCIAIIYEALELDPSYLRGIVYRRHIYTVYKHMREYMIYTNPLYKWDEADDEPIDEEKAEKLLKEAQEIQEISIEQQKAEEFKTSIPQLKLQKPISNFTWKSVGESLNHMHKYITENVLSHASHIQILFEKESQDIPMEICEDVKEPELTENKEENIMDGEKLAEVTSDAENNGLSDKERLETNTDKDRTEANTDKVESDVEMATTEPAMEMNIDNKLQRKVSVRRRGSAVSSLGLWVWCKPKSSRKRAGKETIYDILRRMVPSALVLDVQNKEQSKDTSPDNINLEQIFDENKKEIDSEEYFGTEHEQKDVKNFINKYTEHTNDLIDLFSDYLHILSKKYKLKWPKDLSKVYVEASACYNNHIDIPACTDDNHDILMHYVSVNMLAEEFMVNEKLTSDEDDVKHELNVAESMDVIISQKPDIFPGVECLEMTLRVLWLKVNIHAINKCDTFVLEGLYQLLSEFEAMGEDHDIYSLKLINFTFKPEINENEVMNNINNLERNIKLSIVMDLYNQGNFEGVLSIIIEAFDYCKEIARKQNEKMVLDFAIHMCLIIESYWALNKVDSCFKWALTCLHESLKHYFRVLSVSEDHQKWSRAIIKTLCCLEHILCNVGLSCLEFVTQEELSQGVEDLIRIIGHQIETNSSDMPLDTISPWIILHYIFQREEDQGRCTSSSDKDEAYDEIPEPLKVLFIGHTQLGDKKWCCKSDCKLLYFILDTIVPRLRSPVLAKSLEQISPHMEQVVFCLYGHPVKKPTSKVSSYKYLADHSASGSQTLDWSKAQQLYEIFQPLEMPQLSGINSAISIDTEGLFLRILSFLPTDCNPSKFVPEIEKYIDGIENKFPLVPALLPYKMKDIYFFLGDFNFKRKGHETSIKYNIMDVVVNNDRFLSWAQIALSKAAILDNALLVLKKFNGETDFLNPAKSTIRCFKRALELKPEISYLWVEYGTFVYRVHSFCSRVLKQASESLSMDEFGALEKQKEDYLDITHNCLTVAEDLNSSSDSDKSDNWLLYYTLGKVAEKRNKPPSVYLSFYMQGVKSLQEQGATYPTKISYNTPTHLCIEVLELQYRIHASILKYIEQHENKPIPASVAKVFSNCLEEWLQLPFAKAKKYYDVDIENDPKLEAHSIQAANILKRSISDAGEEETHEAKRLKMESAAAKVRRSASYDTERIANKDSSITASDNKDSKEEGNPNDIDKPEASSEPTTKISTELDDKQPKMSQEDDRKDDKRDESSSSSSSSSSTDSNSSESSSDSSSDSSADTDASSKSSQDNKPITEEEIMKITSACLNALEDCASRYARHYKALYRLAHYHFYYKKGKDVERCRDLMLSTFTSRSGQKMSGLFSERKSKNFFNNIWHMPSNDVERPGGFASHMNRSVLLTLEILKEIDDHKTLLDLSLHLQKDPDKDKQYLRDSDRIDLAQQAFSLCVQSLKGQVVRFSQQADIKSNEVERQALNSLMYDIYKAYGKVQKQTNSNRHLQQLVNLLVDAYKLINTTPITDNMNIVDLTMKYSQSLKQQAVASVDKTQNLQKKQNVKCIEIDKSKVVTSISQPKVDKLPNTSSSVMPKKVSSEMAFQDLLPMLNDSLLSQQTAAALSYFSNMSALAGYASLQNSLQSSLSSSFPNSFQAELYRHILSPYMLQQKKKRGPKPMNRSLSAGASQMKQKPYSVSSSTKAASTSAAKSTPTSVITNLHKSSSSLLAPSMGTVLSTLPASMTANLSSFGTSSTTVPQAHMSTASTSTTVHAKPPMPHQQVSPGKTLQEKLAERQKNLPSKTPSQEINASISRLPSSLTITKTSMSKQPMLHGKKPEPERPRPIASDEIIILDDD